MDVKQIESMRWVTAPSWICEQLDETYSDGEYWITIGNILNFLDYCVRYYSNKLEIPEDFFNPIFKDKNTLLYKSMKTLFNYGGLYRRHGNNVEKFFSMLSVPELPDSVEKLYNDFQNLSDSDKVEFLKRIEPIKTKLQI